MKAFLWVVAGVWAVGLGIVWIWIHAANANDDEVDEILDEFYYAELLGDD